VKTVFLLVVVSVFASAPAGALSLEELLDPVRAEALERGDVLTGLQLRDPAPRLSLRNPRLAALTERLMAEVRPSMMAENLRLYRKREGAGGAGTGAGWTEAERRAVYNRALALSSLAGLEYYSSSRGAMRVFYETSQVIDGPDSRQPLADPHYAEPPEHTVLYARQKDLTFGDNIYRYECYAWEDAIVLVQENMTAMTIGIIPAIAKHRLRSLAVIVDAGPYLVLYTFVLARAASLPGMGTRIGASFTTRIDAIAAWFQRQADRALEDALTGQP
jgi:hypothetical protein